MRILGVWKKCCSFWVLPPPKKKSGHVQNRHKSKGPMLWIIFPKTGKNNVRCWQEELQTILASFINLLLFPYTSPQNVQQTIWPINRKTSSSQDSPLKGTSTNRRYDHWDVCLGYHHGLSKFRRFDTNEAHQFLSATFLKKNQTWQWLTKTWSLRLRYWHCIYYIVHYCVFI